MRSAGVLFFNIPLHILLFSRLKLRRLRLRHPFSFFLIYSSTLLFMSCAMIILVFPPSSFILKSLYFFMQPAQYGCRVHPACFLYAGSVLAIPPRSDMTSCAAARLSVIVLARLFSSAICSGSVYQPQTPFPVASDVLFIFPKRTFAMRYSSSFLHVSSSPVSRWYFSFTASTT